MKYLFITLSILSASIAGVAYAQESPQAYTILLSEVQLGSAESASEEFVEITNTSVTPQSLEGALLQYKSKNGNSWTTKASLTGWIAPFGKVLLSNYLEGDAQEFSGGLAGGSGHLRLVDGDTVIDLVAWGDAVEPDVEAVIPHGAGQSLKRLVDEDGVYVDTNNNLADWFISDTPSPTVHPWDPQTVEAIDAPTEVDSDDVPEQMQDGSETVAPVVEPAISSPPSARLVITEVFPDPKSPLKDAEDEFIELYNPNDQVVDTLGYELHAGADWRYKTSLGSYQLAPGEHLAIFSVDSGVTLSNAGSSVRVLGNDEVEHDEVTYPKAKSGKSWSVTDEGWGWSQPTPHTANTSPVEPVDSAVLGTVDEDTPNELTKRDAPSISEDSSEDSSVTKGSFEEFTPEDTPMNGWVLAGVGGSAVLYALYEYRHDIRIRIQQGRRYLAIRRADRTES